MDPVHAGHSSQLSKLFPFLLLSASQLHQGVRSALRCRALREGVCVICVCLTFANIPFDLAAFLFF